MNYAKLTDEGLVFATNPLIAADDMQHFNPLASQLMSEGYKPVIYTEADAPVGYVAVCVWQEDEDTIFQTWEYHKLNFN
ncbi:MAG: hypothetical protein IJO48_02660 [Clostridia bacterium]|nr:hypothetical protein [Clostridia bacterium]